MKRPTSAPAGVPDECKGIHVGIIMDGNGRWAGARGLPRTAGHRAGVRVARDIVEAAARAGVGTLTLYAFSSDNWRRPAAEVSTLMRLLRRSLAVESKRCIDNGVRLSVVGRRDRLSPALVAAIEDAESATAAGPNLHLRVAIDYSARESILRAASRANGASLDAASFDRLLAEVNHDAFQAGDIDLLIRTGGEQRLSDFMLWECAYAELYFTDRMWPEFNESELLHALREFAGRERRFGAVTAQPASKDAPAA